MKLNIIEDETKSLIVEFEGADRAVAEMIKDRLLGNKDIEYVAVVKEHPDVGKPRLIVRSEKNAKSLVLKAAEQIQDEIKELISQIPKK